MTPSTATREAPGTAVQLHEAMPEPPSEQQYKVLMAQASHLVKAGFLPKGISRPEQVLHIILKGRELGVPATYALSNIAIINGRPTCGAELMLALVYRAYGGNALRVTETSRDKCVVRAMRPEWDGPTIIEWTMEDARLAGLMSNDNWKKYPAAMLRWRAISAAAKLAFPEVVGGVYTPEELGAEVIVHDDGDMEIASEDAGMIADVSGQELDQVPRETFAASEAPVIDAERQPAARVQHYGTLDVEDACLGLAEARGGGETWQRVLMDLCMALGYPERKASALSPEQAENIIETARTQIVQLATNRGATDEEGRLL